MLGLKIQITKYTRNWGVILSGRGGCARTETEQEEDEEKRIMRLAPRSEGPSSRGPQALAGGGALHSHPLPHSQRPRRQQHRGRARCCSTRPLDRRRWVDDTGVRPGQDLEKKMSMPVWEVIGHSPEGLNLWTLHYCRTRKRCWWGIGP
ncbi:uncharacterized protein A4U43_UnF8660 [Asparagus officinalis]|uniref:Uncharacterized protein n=1 Tax=Asparagus officinalis TaxID=4686 RepID=A0A1R3L5X0_ASPOF|nr:uncharacterized protein A4U43_UnF8660 [Asparagus officinalis]